MTELEKSHQYLNKEKNKKKSLHKTISLVVVVFLFIISETEHSY